MRLRRAVVAVVAVAAALVPSAASPSPIPFPPELWFIDPDGTDAREILEDFHSYTGFAWSPDGSEIAYISSQGLTVWNPDTDSERTIVPSSESPFELSWSPDGEWIAYTFSNATTGFRGLRIVSSSGDEKKTLYQDEDSILSGATWAPDSNRVAFARGTHPGQPAEIWVMDIAANSITVLMDVDSQYTRPAWSPQGDWIAYQTFRSEIAVMHPDGSNRHVVSPEGEYTSGPDWSPNGTLAFGAQSGLYVVDPDEGEPTLLTAHGAAPDWSPTGTEIVYIGPNGDVYVIDVGTKAIRQLTEDVRRSNAGPRWSPDGDTIAYVSTPQHVLCPGLPYGPDATIVGTHGDDHLQGTSGSDVIAGLGGNDIIEGLDGADVICGGPGDDDIFGQAGRDTLYGEDGADQLMGGFSGDTLDGGRGADELDGGEGSDTIAFLTGAAGVTVDLADGTSTGAGDDSLVSIENATGTTRKDWLYGDGGKNILKGSTVPMFSDHGDVIGGRAGPDKLFGDDGHDDMSGGSGDDLLVGDDRYGSKGNDELDGGRGDDECRRGETYRSCENRP